MAILGLLVVLIGSAIFNGFVLTILWAWFVAGTFGVRALTIPQALGLGLLVSFLTAHYAGEDKRSSGEKVAYVILLPILFLLMGWIYHLFL